MSEKLEKAEFYLETEEYDKAEEIYSEIFDQQEDNVEAIIGLIICKAYKSDFENNQFKACNVYLNRLETRKLEQEKRQKLIEGILNSVEAYLKKLLEKFREHANELSKRPALDGQLYSVKQLGDTTDYLGYINDNVDRLEAGLHFAEKAYDIELKNKEDIAYRILQLYDFVFTNFRETPQMQGKTLLDANGLQDLKEQRKDWLSRSGENKQKVTADPSDSSGCMVLIIALSSLAASLMALLIAFI